MSGEESCDLVPIGFTEKKIKYNVILSADGEFVTAQQFPKESQFCIVPTTSAAEGRTGSNGAPPSTPSTMRTGGTGESSACKLPEAACRLVQNP